MISRKTALFAGFLTFLLAASTCLPAGSTATPPARPFDPPPFDGSLSVMTYNVEGLPWPVARGRAARLARIGAQLRDMHRRGRAPQLVMLQEAFTDDAQRIGRIAGYRYMVQGPSADAVNPAPMTDADRRFAAAARWSKGETEGKVLGSGLMLLSDYPLSDVRRMVFPAFACAGYDCLANKGALFARVALPGAAVPLEVVTTHLNSRKVSGVDFGRAFEAYRRQLDFLGDFVRGAHDPRDPLIVAGDFNGSSAPRRQMLTTDAAGRWAAGAPVADAMHVARDTGMAMSADERIVLERARDWQFFAQGAGLSLDVAGIAVPFGHDGRGQMLSDHIGYVARYALRQGVTLAPATELARAPSPRSSRRA